MPDAPPEWRKYTPAYTMPRGRHSKPLGAHAFRPGKPKSICGYAPAARAGGPAEDSDRRCDWCQWVIVGKSKDLSDDKRGWGC